MLHLSFVSLRPLALALVLVGCSRSDKGGAADAAPDASATISIAPAPHTSGAPIEARRFRPKKLEEDPALLANVGVLRLHFGGKVPEKLLVQSADVSAHRRAILAFDESKPSGEAAPIVFLAGEDGVPTWVKERPAAGILAPIGPLAIAPGPRGRVALAVCDPPTSAVAVRLWDEDGSPFADFSAMDTEACDAISIIHWPRVGWVVVVVKPGATRAQLLRESGGLAWGRGIEIGTRAQKPTGASLAIDTDDTFVLVERAPTDGTRDHVLGFRYDASGIAQWPSPVDLGETKLPPGERIVLSRPHPGLVRATVAPGSEVDVLPKANGGLP